MALKAHFPKQDVAYYLPTFPLVEDIAFQRFPELCERKGWHYKLNKSGGTPNISFPDCGRILFRTMENPERIVGYEVGNSILDELDTLKRDKARKVWNKVIARNRQKMPGGFPNTVAVATTPEGFEFVWEMWEKNPDAVAQGYLLFRARTMDNAANLPAGYIENLRNTYPSNLLQAYLEGQFVNLTAGTVYSYFDRNRNRSRLLPMPGAQLHIGMDFNVGKMAAVVHIIHDGQPHAVWEFTDVLDTPTMCTTIRQRFPEENYPVVMVYPDASGRSRKSANASVSDHQILRNARFRVCVNNVNPAVKDRVISMNKGFEENRYFVNSDTCGTYVECLEKQPYDKNGEPDKSSGLDHAPDAGGYFIVYKYPVLQRAAVFKPLVL